VTDGFSLTKPTCVSAVDQIVFAAGILRDAKTRRTLTGTGARCGRFSPDGSLFVTTRTRRPAIFDTGSLAVVTLPGVHATSAAFRPDGRFVAAATDNGVQIWSVTGRKFLGRALPWAGYEAREVAFDPSGQLLFVGGARGAWLWRPWSNSSPERLRLALRAPVQVWSAQFSPGGSMLATLADAGDVRLWRVRGSTATPVRTLRGPVQALAFGPHGRYLATVGAGGGDGKEPLVKVWDLSRRRVVDQLPAPGPKARVSFAPETGVLAVASGRKIVRRDWSRHRTLEPFSTDRGTILDTAFSADGRMLAAGISTVDRGGTEVWDIGRNEVAAWLSRPQMGAVAGVEFGRRRAGEGALLLAVSRNNRIRLFRCDACLPLGQLVKLAESRIRAAS
jgi:WD40 repeat protein